MLLKACCEASRISNYYNSLQPRSEADCIKSNHASIAEMKADGEVGTESIKRYLLNALLQMSKAFNRSVGLNGEQLELTIDLILEDPVLPNLKLDDVKLCFRRAMTGEYGEIYSIDPNIVLTWLKRYFRGRILAGERVSQEEHAAELAKPINRNASWRKAVEDLARHMSEARPHTNKQRQR